MITKVLTTVFFLSLAMITVGCCSIPQEPVDAPDNDVVIQIEVKSATATYRKFDVEVYFYEWVGEHDGVAQEIFLPDGKNLVEYFRTPNGRMLKCHYDHHTVSYDRDVLGVKLIRRMYVYTANVDGVDWDDNFAQLPQNKDGSVKTTTGAEFNATYQKKHKTQGRITEDAHAEGFWWSIIWEDGKVTVQIPEEHRYTAK